MSQNHRTADYTYFIHSQAETRLTSKLYINHDFSLSDCFRKKDKVDIALEELEEKDTDNVNLTKRSKKRDSYDYLNTVQMLGE